MGLGGRDPEGEGWVWLERAAVGLQPGLPRGLSPSEERNVDSAGQLRVLELDLQGTVCALQGPHPFRPMFLCAVLPLQRCGSSFWPD